MDDNYGVTYGPNPYGVTYEPEPEPQPRPDVLDRDHVMTLNDGRTITLPAGMPRANAIEIAEAAVKFNQNYVAPKPYEPEPKKEFATSFAKELASAGNAFMQGLDQPTEGIGITLELLGAEGVGGAFRDLVDARDEDYVNATEAFKNDNNDGFNWEFMPRAILEQSGQLLGSVIARVAGGVMGGALGGVAAGPTGAAAGATVGAFGGPFAFMFVQLVGPMALERARNDGRETPTLEDWHAAALASGVSSSFESLGAMAVGKLASSIGRFGKSQLANATIQEGLTEFTQEIVEQLGATAGTEKGAEVNWKQALAAGLLGAGSGAAVQTPFSLASDAQDQDTKLLRRMSKRFRLSEEAALRADYGDQVEMLRAQTLREIEAHDRQQRIDAGLDVDPNFEVVKNLAPGDRSVDDEYVATREDIEDGQYAAKLSLAANTDQFIDGMFHVEQSGDNYVVLDQDGNQFGSPVNHEAAAYQLRDQLAARQPAALMARTVTMALDASPVEYTDEQYSRLGMLAMKSLDNTISEEEIGLVDDELERQGKAGAVPTADRIRKKLGIEGDRFTLQQIRQALPAQSYDAFLSNLITMRDGQRFTVRKRYRPVDVNPDILDRAIEDVYEQNPDLDEEFMHEAEKKAVREAKRQAYWAAEGTWGDVVEFDTKEEADKYAKAENAKDTTHTPLKEFDSPGKIASKLAEVMAAKNIDVEIDSPEFRTLASGYVGNKSPTSLRPSEARFLYERLKELPRMRGPTPLPNLKPQPFTLKQLEEARQAVRNGVDPEAKALRKALNVNPKQADALANTMQAEVAREKPVYLLTDNRNYNKIQEALDAEMSRLGLGDVGLKLSNKLHYLTSDQGRVGKEIPDSRDGYIPDGQFSPALKLIELSTAAVDPNYEMSTDELIEAMSQVLHHEALHAMREMDLITEQEYEMLARAARNRKRPDSDKTFYEYAQEAYGQHDVAYIEEEAVAEYVRHTIQGMRVRGGIRRIANKIRNFLEGLANVMRGLGYHSADDVVAAIKDGEIGTRARNEVRSNLIQRRNAGEEVEFRHHHFPTETARQRTPGAALQSRRPNGMPLEYNGREYGYFDTAINAAQKYAEWSGYPHYTIKNYAPVDPVFASRIAEEYEVMKHQPSHPIVKRSYDAMIQETQDQYRFILDTGLRVEFIEGESPYSVPRDAVDDVIDNNHLYVFSTREGFGSNEKFDPRENPLLVSTEFVDLNGKPMLANDVFRVVHDYFGHVMTGVGFRARGEENAWQAHAGMYSPVARRAMTSETRGQNSWVNYGPHGETNRTASESETVYADQKTGLLPMWASEVNRESARDRKDRFDEARRTGSTGYEGALTEDGFLRLVHWGHDRFDVTDPSRAGTGAARLHDAKRWKHAFFPGWTYFGIEDAEVNPYRKESMLGPHKHAAEVPGELIYNASKDELGLWSRRHFTDEELVMNIRSIMDAGYMGYMVNTRELGKVVFVFDRIRVRPADQPRTSPSQPRFSRRAVESAEKLGYKQPGWHATTSSVDFDTFEMGDLGFHFATRPEGANKRLRDIAGNQLQELRKWKQSGGREEHFEFVPERILPVRLRANKPLRLGDAGNWTPSSVGYELQEAGLIDSAQADQLEAEAIDLFDNALRKLREQYPNQGTKITVQRPGSVSGERVDHPDTAKYINAKARLTYLEMQPYRDFITSLGYDSVIYKNSIEDSGVDSIIVFNPEDVRSIFNESPTPTTRFSRTLNQDMKRAFVELGELQRGEPEIAMVRAQHALGGGVLSYAIEHTGDLTHRMTEQLKWRDDGFGYEYVANKVNKVLRVLNSGYGFEREHNENMQSNARVGNTDPATYIARADEALRAYADAHAALPAYNDAQRHARDAAVSLGRKQFDAARNHLNELANHLGSEEEWNAYAGQVDGEHLPVSTSRFSKRVAAQDTVGERDKLGMFSPVREAVVNMQQETGTVEQIQKYIAGRPGVKAEELEWSGLTDYLSLKSPKDKITKAELIEVLNNDPVSQMWEDVGLSTETGKGTVETRSFYDEEDFDQVTTTPDSTIMVTDTIINGQELIYWAEKYDYWAEKYDTGAAVDHVYFLKSRLLEAPKRFEEDEIRDLSWTTVTLANGEEVLQPEIHSLTRLVQYLHDSGSGENPYIWLETSPSIGRIEDPAFVVSMTNYTVEESRVQAASVLGTVDAYEPTTKNRAQWEGMGIEGEYTNYREHKLKFTPKVLGFDELSGQARVRLVHEFGFDPHGAGAEGAGGFTRHFGQGTHFDEDDIIAFMRTTDRATPIPGIESEVLPSFHIDEAQSDLHQHGRQRFYYKDQLEFEEKLEAESGFIKGGKRALEPRTYIRETLGQDAAAEVEFMEGLVDANLRGVRNKINGTLSIADLNQLATPREKQVLSMAKANMDRLISMFESGEFRSETGGMFDTKKMDKAIKSLTNTYAHPVGSLEQETAAEIKHAFISTSTPLEVNDMTANFQLGADVKTRFAKMFSNPVRKFAKELPWYKDYAKKVTDFEEHARSTYGKIPAPDSPFKGDGWINLLAKRAIIKAVEEGKGLISWPVAETVVERWGGKGKELFNNIYDVKFPKLIGQHLKTKPIKMKVPWSKHPVWVATITADKAEQVSTRGLPRFSRRPVKGAVQMDRESMNRAAAGENKSFYQKVKEFTKRELWPSGNMPEKIFDMKIWRDSQIGSNSILMANYIAELDKALKKTTGKRYDALDEEQRLALDAALKGFAVTLPQEVALAIGAMRNHLDSLSRAYEQILADDIRRMADAGVDRDVVSAKEDLLLTIMSHENEYVHRSYKAFNEKSWPSRVWKNKVIMENARSYLREQYLLQGLSPEMASEATENMLHELLRVGTAADPTKPSSLPDMIKLLGTGEHKVGAKDLSVLKQRQDIALPIRELLGENHDLLVNYTSTATKLGSLIFNDQFQKAVIKATEGEIFFKEFVSPGVKNHDRPQGYNYRIGGSQAYSPLSEYLTSDIVAQSFEDIMHRMPMSQWYRAVVRANGFIKYGKTILAPTTMARNFLSASFFAIANGHFNIFGEPGRTALASAPAYFHNLGDMVDYQRRLRELGVVYEGASSGEILSLLRDMEADEALNAAEESGIVGVKKMRTFFKYAERAYRFGDDFWKIIGFENEVNMLMRATGKTRMEVEPMAAERIRQTYPTYSLVGRFPRWLRKMPLAGTFVSFPAEIVRTSWNMMSMLKQDWEMSPEIGARRTVGLLIAGGLTFAAQELSKSLLGLDDDDEEAYRLAGAPWNENSNLLFVGRGDPNNPVTKDAMRIVDLSHLDAYNMPKRIAVAMLRDQPTHDKLVDMAEEAFLPFFGRDIAAGALMDALSNQKESGGPIYSSADTFFEKFYASVEHVSKVVRPGFLGNVEGILKANQGHISPSKVYTMEDEIAAVMGVRVTQINPKVSLAFRAIEYSQGLRDAATRLSRVAGSPNEVTDDELIDAYDEAATMAGRVYNDAMRIAKAAMSVGTSQTDIVKALSLGGINRSDAHKIARGEVPVWTPSSQFLKRQIESAGDTYGRETAATLRQRKLFIERLARQREAEAKWGE